MTKSHGSGGTEGGQLLYWIGMGLCVLAMAFFLNSVYASSGMGWIRGMFHGRGRGGGGGGLWETTSMGVLFVPFLIGAIVLLLQRETEMGLGAVGHWAGADLHGNPQRITVQIRDESLVDDRHDAHLRRRRRTDVAVVLAGGERKAR